MPYRPIDPEDTDVTQAWIDDALLRVQTSMPGRVQSYDPATQTADVVPLLRVQVPQGDGSNAFEALPVVPHVPVKFPRGGGFAVTFPMAPGDFVLLVACSGDLGTWFAGDGSVTTPVDLRRHHLGNVVAIPGLFPRARALAHPSSNLCLGLDSADASGTLEIASDGTVTLNGGTAAVGRVGDQVQVTLDATAIAAIIAPSGGGPCSGGPVTLTGTITAGAPKVKA